MNEVRMLSFPQIQDPRGCLSFLEHPLYIPFKIERTFWTFDVPGGVKRGGHAYAVQNEIIIALSGSFDVVITNPDGSNRVFSLNRSYYGLLIPPLNWRHLENFSTNSLGLHISSSKYDPKDYIFDFENFKMLNSERK